jgi:hypothetical protein
MGADVSRRAYMPTRVRPMLLAQATRAAIAAL